MKPGKIYLLIPFAVLLALWASGWGRSAVRPPQSPAGLIGFAAIAPQEIKRGPQGRRQIALTFDAGSEADAFPELLAVLERMQVKATFFLTGKWLERYPQHADRLRNSLHSIGNHSWSHPEYTGLSEEALRLDLLATDAALSKFFGTPIRPLFRPPFGDRDSRVLRLLGENGYLSVYWTFDTLDSMEPRKSPEFITRRILGQTDAALDGSIILAHVGYPETCAAMPGIIDSLRARGFDFVTLSDWLGCPQIRQSEPTR